MKKLFFFLSGIACIVGIVLMYTGYCKAQGEFWGEHYAKGDYTDFAIGGTMVVVSILIFLVVYSGLQNIKINMNMNKIITNTIQALSLVSFIIGMFTVIAGFSKDAGYLVDGIGIIIGSVFLAGFSYIVEAACIYIEKQKEEAQKEENQ